jgi:hypothetical protein
MEGSGTCKKWGSSGRKLEHWGHALEGDIVMPALFSLFLFLGCLKVNSFAPPALPQIQEQGNQGPWIEISETVSQINLSSFQLFFSSILSQ